MPDAIHVLLTDYGQFGWGISSPQLPELIGGRDTREELFHDLDELIVFGGGLAEAPRLVHLQTHEVLANGDELVVRVAQDDCAAERAWVKEGLTSALSFAGQVTDMLNVPRRPTGEALFVCALPTDTLGWFAAQMEDQDALCVVAAVDGVDHRVIRVQVRRHGDGGVPLENPLTAEAMGFTPETTLDDVIRVMPPRHAAPLLLASAS